MFIVSRQGFSNLGRRLDSQEWIKDKWNMRYSYSCVVPQQDDGIPAPGGYKWLLRMKSAGKYACGIATDANRNWDSLTQDIVIVFNTKCQDAALTPGNPATGHTISVGGSPQTTTYQSGSGTASWVLRIPILCDADDLITYSYDQGTGDTKAVDDGVEIAAVTGEEVGNSLTRKIRFLLKGSDNNPVISETVKLAVHFYNAGAATEGPGDNITKDNPCGGIWMRRVMNATPTTDTNGIVDIPYTGIALAAGASVYIVVF